MVKLHWFISGFCAVLTCKVKLKPGAPSLAGMLRLSNMNVASVAPRNVLGVSCPCDYHTDWYGVALCSTLYSVVWSNTLQSTMKYFVVLCNTE